MIHVAIENCGSIGDADPVALLSPDRLDWCPGGLRWASQGPRLAAVTLGALHD